MDRLEPGIRGRLPLVRRDAEEIGDLRAHVLGLAGVEVVEVRDRGQPLDQRAVLGERGLELAVQARVLDRAAGDVAQELRVDEVVLAEGPLEAGEVHQADGVAAGDERQQERGTQGVLGPSSRAGWAMPGLYRLFRDTSASRGRAPSGFAGTPAGCCSSCA